MIKRIELINFMSHRHTVIEPADGLTVLVGPNNCGKSAFVTALQILCHNSNSGFVIRHGEKRCDVIVETDQGNVIQWSRKKNGAGTYVIDGQPFDRLRGKVPEELHKVLRMPKVECDSDDFDIHFGEQAEPVFLLRNRGKAAAQFFASSSDATHLVAMQSLHKSKVTVAKRDATRLLDRKSTLESQLNSLKPLESIQAELADCEQQHAGLVAQDEEIEQLKIVIAAIKDSRRKVDLLDRKTDSLRTLLAPPTLPDTRPLQQLVLGIRGCELRFTRSVEYAETLNAVQSPPSFVQYRPLENLIHQLAIVKRNEAQLSDRIAAFVNFDEPPELRDSRPLENLCVAIGRNEQRHRRFAKQSTCFEDLTSPEKIKDEQTLESLIQKLFDVRRNFFQHQRSVTVLDGLPAPPVEANSDSLADWVERFRGRSKTLEEKAGLVVKAQRSLDEITVELENWVCDNPVCPTCGGPTDREHVLDRLGGGDV